MRWVCHHLPKKLPMKRKNTPLFILFFDETMIDRVRVNKDGGLGRHRFVIILSSKKNDDGKWDQKTRNAQ
jgi:hypothetical protein